MFRNQPEPVGSSGGSPNSAGALASDDRERLVEMLRRLCLEQGWDVCALARRAGVSRTTLHHLLTGTTRRPHLATLGRIANALGVRFQAEETTARNGNAASPGAAEFRESGPAVLADGAFDRATNPAVEETRRTCPALFAGWSREEWDELYSTFGVGGNLTAEGAAECARAINDRRETTRQLHLVLETHLADVASRFIETLYEMVRPPTVSGPPVEPESSQGTPQPRDEAPLCSETFRDAASAHSTSRAWR